MAGSTASLSAVHTGVVDPGAVLGFYRDPPGMRLQSDTFVDGCPWIRFVTESPPAVEIVLSQPHAGRSRDALVALLADGELRAPSFDTENLMASFDRIAATPDFDRTETRRAMGRRRTWSMEPDLHRASGIR